MSFVLVISSSSEEPPVFYIHCLDLVTNSIVDSFRQHFVQHGGWLPDGASCNGQENPIMTTNPGSGETVRILPHTHDLGGGVTVRRVLPSPERRAVGPFVFMDHIGPITLSGTNPIDVRPHPHIGLATVTYLWEGRIEHRDSLGNTQLIEAGAVNWMTAGRGVVHSERSAARDRGREQRMHGLQLWVALPLEHEQDPPSFQHTAARELPQVSVGSGKLRVVAGGAYGERSPVPVLGDLFYVDAQVPRGERLRVPDNYAQRAAYVIDGEMYAGGQPVRRGELTLFASNSKLDLNAAADSHVVLLGGAPLDAPRYLWWNYVASSEARIEEAKRAWIEKRYTMIDGDPEFIPLPVDGRATVHLKAE
jgi:redox-sensitive bicupin YhaK (pirin superfamily)